MVSQEYDCGQKNQRICSFSLEFNQSVNELIVLTYSNAISDDASSANNANSTNP